MEILDRRWWRIADDHVYIHWVTFSNADIIKYYQTDKMEDILNEFMKLNGIFENRANDIIAFAELSLYHYDKFEPNNNIENMLSRIFVTYFKFLTKQEKKDLYLRLDDLFIFTYYKKTIAKGLMLQILFSMLKKYQSKRLHKQANKWVEMIKRHNEQDLDSKLELCDNVIIKYQFLGMKIKKNVI